MSRNYPNYTKPSHYDRNAASSRNTDDPVWAAICIRANHYPRDPGAVWSYPSPADWDEVTMCLNEWAALGDIESGTYRWGEEEITVDAAIDAGKVVDGVKPAESDRP